MTDPSQTATAAATALTLAGIDAEDAGVPTLVLAVGADGLRGPEAIDLVGRKLTVGRGFEGFGAAPIEDGRRSRAHLEFRCRGDDWLVQDAGSSNGTRLNGEPLTEQTALSFGDVLRAGDTVFIYARGGAAGDPDPELIGDTPAARAMLDALRTVAPHPHTVLLLGETGSGKEVAAQVVHRLSRRSGRFVAVNCGAFTEGTLESELFGHRKGAFTGAVEANRGLFRAADGGTLFLDEIGEMPAGLQVRLLRTLESRTVRPVGESRDFDIDVRVVAATHRDLVQAVQSGSFRSDLYARLSQWPVHLPPLRERKADIPLLVQHILRGKHGGPRPIKASLAEALLLHPWPLNVRGLANVVSMAAIAAPPGEPLAPTREVLAALAAAEAIATAPEVEPVATPNLASAPAPLPADEVVDEALRRTEGKVAAVARELGLSRQQLYRWLKQRGATIDDYRG